MSRRAAATDAHDGYPTRGGGARAVRARAAFARAVWSRSGERRLPGARELDDALTALRPADLEWLCEFAPLGPLYLLPTRAFVHALAKAVRAAGARRVLEVAAGDGFLARSLASADASLDVVATDSGAWQRPAARMSAAERRELAGVAVPGVGLGPGVRRMSARGAIEAFKPDLVLASWLPPGRLLDALVRSPVRHVLEIGAGGGVTPGAWSWRFAHETLEDLERLARNRLDARPARTLHSRVTLYFGRAHEEHAEERVRPGDWLWQFRPAR